MIEIIFTACLITDHNHCETVRMKEAFDGNNPYMCVYMAQSKVADYMEKHPEYYVTKFGCIKEGTKDS